MAMADIETKEAAELLGHEFEGATILGFEWEWAADGVNPAAPDHLEGMTIHLRKNGRKYKLDLSAMGWHGIQSLIVLLEES